MGVLKTVNLGLNQYVQSDPVRAEDFNEDNRKIDVAVGEAIAANPWVKLFDVTTQAETANVELDLSSVNISDYLMFRVHCPTSPEYPTTYIRLNKVSSGYIGNSSGSWTTGSPMSYCYPEGGYFDINVSAGSNTIYIHSLTSAYKLGLNPTNLTTIDVLKSTNPVTYPVGSRFLVWGMKQ